MRVLIVHSDVAPDAPIDEQDTLLQAKAIAAALLEKGHEVSSAVFVPNAAAMESLVAADAPDVVFNLVESVWGLGIYAPLAPAMFSNMGIPFTGVSAAAMAATGDKLLSKRLLKSARLPTPAWSQPPHWRAIGEGRWIVKSVTEDASFGLDDGAVVSGREAVAARAQASAAKHGGHWFAERYIHGREFNVALIERNGVPAILPIGEMVFERWDDSRPRIVGYAAKWEEATPEYRDTTRMYGWHRELPELEKTLEKLARDCWSLFGLTGYARVDFRVDAENRPYILEINPNPCLEPNAGVAMSCAQAGLSYAELIDDIVRAALHG
ncbi:MAG: ATP-grasp domain-containing protein [Alphaproteobacteria bacterium]|nr:ATP-grasp domain-containing protein [Alphaproteobacteria bacterium]